MLDGKLEKRKWRLREILAIPFGILCILLMKLHDRIYGEAIFTEDLFAEEEEEAMDAPPDFSWQSMVNLPYEVATRHAAIVAEHMKLSGASCVRKDERLNLILVEGWIEKPDPLPEPSWDGTKLH